MGVCMQYNRGKINWSENHMVNGFGTLRSVLGIYISPHRFRKYVYITCTVHFGFSSYLLVLGISNHLITMSTVIQRVCLH